MDWGKALRLLRGGERGIARGKALRLLRGGEQGVAEWNRRRGSGETIPDLSGADLSGAELSRADLHRAHLFRADLGGADLGGADLSGAQLGGAELRGAHLSGAQLGGAELRGAHLSGAQLGGADLSGADLSRADLSRADLSRADLSEAHFFDAELRGADLSGAHLGGADLGGTTCSFTIFGNVDLSAVKGLDSINHLAPSTVGIDTLFRSGRKIPEEFLRGCGVPDALIQHLPYVLNAMEPIQFYSCFISYSTKNQDFAERLHSRLRDKGLRVWFSPEDGQGGKKLYEQIDEAIRLHDKLLLVLSPESMKSEWVMTGIRRARKAEIREGRRKLFPIRLVDFETIRDWECFDADNGKDLAVEIREYLIPDFTSWKDHDVFEEAFARLVRDLESKESTVGKGP